MRRRVLAAEPRQRCGKATDDRQATGRHPPHSMEGVTTCRVCGHVIGVYEPLVIVSDERSHQTSLAREPDLARSEHVLHKTCAASIR